MTSPLKYPSQAVAWPYVASAVALFALQTLFGLLLAAQFIWPMLASDLLPFNVARASHLNLLVFWLLLGLMGASYYLIPEETDREIFSPPLAYAQLGILLLSGVGALATFWFTGASMGKPFTEAAWPWPLGIALGAVLFLVNIGITIVAAPRRTAIAIVLFSGMTGLSLLYLLTMPFYQNLAVDYFWWWWVIHLWVEGTWELIAAAIAAWLLIKLTGVDRERMYRWMYVEVALVMITGIIGIGHHYYWIGTPGYWITVGAVFSAFEPLPIVLMTWDAFHSVKAARGKLLERVPTMWMVGGAIGHLLGAGVWGFAITLPQVNQWTHGTLLTAAHGHFAFYGAFGMLVLGFAVWSYSRLLAPKVMPVMHGVWAFWLMVTGMLSMVMAFTIAGVVQTYLWRVVGFDFMQVRTEYVTPYMVGILVSGALLFTPGVALFAWDYFHVSRGVLAPVRAAFGRPARAATAA
jgi:nitric oxide reductase subunit B